MITMIIENINLFYSFFITVDFFTYLKKQSFLYGVVSILFLEKSSETDCFYDFLDINHSSFFSALRNKFQMAFYCFWVKCYP